MNKLFVAWRSGGPDQGAWGPVGMLCYSENLYRFCYTRGARTLEGFRAFPHLSKSSETVPDASIPNLRMPRGQFRIF